MWLTCKVLCSRHTLYRWWFLVFHVHNLFLFDVPSESYRFYRWAKQSRCTSLKCTLALKSFKNSVGSLWPFIDLSVILDCGSTFCFIITVLLYWGSQNSKCVYFYSLFQNCFKTGCENWGYLYMYVGMHFGSDCIQYRYLYLVEKCILKDKIVKGCTQVSSVLRLLAPRSGHQ